jgi:hypothetical protein
MQAAQQQRARRGYQRVPYIDAGRQPQKGVASLALAGRDRPVDLGWLAVNPKRRKVVDVTRTSQFARVGNQNVPLRTKRGEREAISEYVENRHFQQSLENYFLPSRSIRHANTGEVHQYVTALRPLISYDHLTRADANLSKRQKCTYGTYIDPDTKQRKCIKNLDHHEMPEHLLTYPDKANTLANRNRGEGAAEEDGEDAPPPPPPRGPLPAPVAPRRSPRIRNN